MNGKSSEKKGNMTNNRLKIKNKKNSETKVNIRTAVFCELCHYAENDTFINISLDSTIKKLNLSGHDRDFFTALVYGVTERQITLDYFLSNLSSIPLEKLDLT
ncbi:MAG: transcription antitermination factor NusB, partial [Clostridia bacterium]|nr:transcription antitermination factor NusB [Clostridia bacterium]